MTEEELGHITSTIDHEVHFITDDFSLKKAAQFGDKSKIVVRSSTDKLYKDLQYVKDAMAKNLGELPMLDLAIKVPEFAEKAKIAISELDSELDQNLVKEISNFAPKRHAPSENPISNFLIGCYLNEAKKNGIEL